MGDNLSIWNALSKTDPAHTKGFNRAGGFKGTAIKPIWIIHQLTKQFGPAGIGWGVGEPTFQVVPTNDETLVFCTVSAWHGTRENVLWGVGGDKVMAKRSGGSFSDDEAFKKAFTDAVGNAFKSLGVGADVHMGLFDDDKYVRRAEQDFRQQEAEAEQTPESVAAMLAGINACDTILALKGWAKQHGDAANALGGKWADMVRSAYDDRKAGIDQLAKVAA